MLLCITRFYIFLFYSFIFCMFFVYLFLFIRRFFISRAYLGRFVKTTVMCECVWRCFPRVYVAVYSCLNIRLFFILVVFLSSFSILLFVICSDIVCFCRDWIWFWNYEKFGATSSQSSRHCAFHSFFLHRLAFDE